MTTFQYVVAANQIGVTKNSMKLAWLVRYFILIQFHWAATLYISFFQSIAQNLQEFAANMTCNCRPLHIKRISIAIVCAKSLLY